MASSQSVTFLLGFLLILIYISSHANANAKAFLLSISKDPSTLQYVTHLNMGTPPVKKSLVLDLGGRHMWLDCENGYNSSTYKPGHCGTAPCSVAKSKSCGICSPYRPGCSNYTCLLVTDNTVTLTGRYGEVSVDTVSIRSTDGLEISISNFIFSCTRTLLLKGLTNGVKGMLGLGRNEIGLPTQLSFTSNGNLSRKFALCLPSTSKANGALLLGKVPYIFYPTYNRSRRIDVSSRFTYTRLYINPVSTALDVKGEPSAEFFVRVNSIMVNKKSIPINSKLLSFDNNGFGGTKLSTVNPYTVLESSIYSAFVKVFDEEIATRNVSKVKAAAPFTHCYANGNLGMTLLGLDVPDIRFVFENEKVFWELYGANSMVEISPDVACLGFLDGGSNPRTSIVIGAHQLQDNLLQFDLAASKLAFTSTLLFESIECSNFKF